jgi:hypothetical protein
LPTKYNHLITILREIENYNFSDSDIGFSNLFNESFKEKDNSFVNIDDLNLDFVPEVQTTSLDLDSNFFKEVRNLSSKK